MELINFKQLIESEVFKSDKIILVDTSIADDEIELFLKGATSLKYYRHFHNPYDGATIVDSLMIGLCEWLPPDIHDALVSKILSTNCGLHPRVYRFLCSKVFSASDVRKLIHLRERDCIGLETQDLDFFRSILGRYKESCSIFMRVSGGKWWIDKKEFFQYVSIKKNNVFMDKVYFSHKQNVPQSDSIVGLLTEELQKRNIPYSIDLEDLKLQGSIHEYGDEIGEGKWVIVILVNDYLKSQACMYEMAQIFANGKAHERIFPIVDRNGLMWDKDKLDETRDFWREKLDAAQKGISPDTPSEYAIKNVNEINAILKQLDAFWVFVNDRISQNMDGFKKTEAVSFVDLIYEKMHEGHARKGKIQVPHLETKNLKDIGSNKVIQSGEKNIYIQGSVHGDINM